VSSVVDPAYGTTHTGFIASLRDKPKGEVIKILRRKTQKLILD
jgi:hypothetical protein